MKIKGLVDEDFVNYKNPAMFIGSVVCDWKCCSEQHIDKSICQNSDLARSITIDISMDEIYHRYINNSITNAIVIGGLEPFLQFKDIYELIRYFRVKNCEDDFVIYTGYYKNEIYSELLKLSLFSDIIIKFGRFIPNQKEHYDKILGVYLVSDNQYAEKIS